mmetsp:Transcript_14735/g.14343  ORF Transcript_14735/g.14343 Transcript_14735/m.14343 type:complete len:83 (+) Transcript_14735:299-547(+)
MYFIKRALIVTNSSNQVKKYQTGLTVFALAFTAAILWTSFESQSHLTCSSTPFSYQFYFLSGMDIIQSVVILVTSCIFVKHL